MPRREERTARRAESLVGGDGARGGRDTCGIWNGLVAGWTYKYMRVGYSCRLRFRCALGLVEDSARGGTGSTRSICPNPATHSGRQHITVGLFAPLISITLNASSPEDRVIVTIWVPQAQTLFPGGATVQGVVDLARVATTRGQANASAVRSLRNRTLECHVGYMLKTWRSVSGSPSRAGPPIQGCALNTAEGADRCGSGHVRD